MWKRLATILVLAFTWALTWEWGVLSSFGQEAPSSADFPRPFRVQKQVEFWKTVFGKIPSHQAILHDSECVSCVYEVVTVSESAMTSRQRRNRLKTVRERWHRILLSLDTKTKGSGLAYRGELRLSLEERQVYSDFKNWFEADGRVPARNLFKQAAQRSRMRFQFGLKDHFEKGYHQAGLYLDEMEKIFEKEGVPRWLTRLPYVESSFNLRAKSKVGASGIWQFMRSTGRHYLRIDASVDERNDPLRATEAAAKLLRENFQELGSWPLAITAYNHGRNGMKRAIKKVGSRDLGEIIDRYQSRSFGFASANFYAEFLAVVDVERERSKTPDQEWVRAEPLSFFEVPLPRAILAGNLVSMLKLSEESLRELNPGVSSHAWKNRIPLRRGYSLRMPLAEGDRAATAEKVFLAGFSKIPPSLLTKPDRGIASSTQAKPNVIRPVKNKH